MTQVQSEFFSQVSLSVGKHLGQENLATLLHRIGVEPTQPDETPVSQSQFATFLRDACRLADDVTLAARLGIEIREAHTLTAYVVKSSATLREAIHNAAKFYPLTNAEITFRTFHDHGTEVVEVVNSDGAMLRHHKYQEFLIFTFLSRARTLTASNFRPPSLRFRHQIQSDQRAYEALAGCPVRFGADVNGIAFRPSVLDTPLTGRDPKLAAYLKELGTAKLKQLRKSGGNTRARVETIVINSLPGQQITADEVAAQMGMTRRTLARHLKEEQTTFRSVLDDLRFDIAKTYLRDGHGISAIAFHLGYADQAAFSTAFRRWAGQSPRAFSKHEQT